MQRIYLGNPPLLLATAREARALEDWAELRRDKETESLREGRAHGALRLSSAACFVARGRSQEAAQVIPSSPQDWIPVTRPTVGLGARKPRGAMTMREYAMRFGRRCELTRAARRNVVAEYRRRSIFARPYKGNLRVGNGARLHATRSAWAMVKAFLPGAREGSAPVCRVQIQTGLFCLPPGVQSTNVPEKQSP